MTRNVHPRQARSQFLESRKATQKHSTYRAYKFPTRDFVEHLEKDGVTTTQEIDGFHIEEWKLKRQSEGIAPATLKSNVKQVKTFLIWCERASMVNRGVGQDIEVPTISVEDAASQEYISSDAAQDVLSYLETYHYATRNHAVFLVLWETGCRISGAMSLDVSDLHSSENHISFVDRKQTGTALKNGKTGERNVTITDKLGRVLNDYIEINRHDVTDDHDRRPLFTTPYGRSSRQNHYKNVVAFTRPCVYGEGCPKNRDVSTCEATKKKKAYECPVNASPHPIRRGSITHHLNRGWPKDKVSDRCDVSVEILEKHYNRQSKEDERKQRMKYVENL